MVARHRASLGPLLATLGACAPSDTVVLSWPGDDALRRGWVLLAESGGSVQGWADADPAGPLIAPLHTTDPVELSLLAYDTGLTGIELPAGPLDIVSDPAIRSRELPVPSEVYRTTVTTDREAGPWVIGAPSPLASGVEIRDTRPSKCGTFTRTRQVVLDTPTPYVWFVTHLDPRSVLTGSTDWTRLIVDGRATDWPGVRISAALPLGGADFVLGGETGVWRGRWSEGAWVATSTLPPPLLDAPVHLVFDPQGTLHALTYRGRIAAFRGDRWTLAYDYEPLDGTNAGGLIVLGDGRMLAAFGASPILVEIDAGGNPRAHDVSLLGASGITALGLVPALGVLLGTSNGELYAWEGGSSLRLLANVAAAPRVILPLPGGAFVGGDQGLIVEYRADQGLCEPAGILTGHVRWAALDGDQIEVAHSMINRAAVSTLRLVAP